METSSPSLGTIRVVFVWLVVVVVSKQTISLAAWQVQQVVGWKRDVGSTKQQDKSPGRGTCGKPFCRRIQLGDYEGVHYCIQIGTCVLIYIYILCHGGMLLGHMNNQAGVMMR